MPEYELPDEPRPSRWTSVAVNPLWPLLAFMFGGSWMAYVWFLVNGAAIGSPHRRREAGLAFLAIAGTLALSFGFGALVGRGLVGDLGARFLLLGITLWKLAFAYLLYSSQVRVFSLYEYYGGLARNGVWGVLAAFVLAGKLNATVPVFWRIVLL